ncbi:hypothetical protein KUCAC02_006711 [Chaenocephalus aceratus]|uniref:Uncharacterized protein n=1 Tax=Chaenocephalus aceratus TaxID=36190 RepID=A0ACB9VTS4_CHAAC|nr:hypothetical protein KUCAC02_006711 [Chaenocephalus aceratus]
MATAQCVLLLAVHILLISEFILANGDYYEILGVPKEATERQIKKAFHKLALMYHPDRNRGPNAEAKFREIAEAYETLSDDKRRREYDQFGHGPSTGGGHQGGGGPTTSTSTTNPSTLTTFSKTLTLLAHREAASRQKRQGGFGGGLFDDMFEDLEKMFSFNTHTSRTDSRFQGKQHCRTVTQRRGNMVTTFTDCS